jgi:dTDP-4-dehydrorhamnose reductase
MSKAPARKVLVLGATGLLGHTLVPHLRRAGFSVVAHGNNSTSGADLRCDATDANQLRNVIVGQSWDFIVNLIALTNVDRCNAEIDLAYRLNVKVVENIVAAVAGQSEGRARLIQISTDHIYDKDVGASAEHEVIMRNVYALSKYAGELAAQGCESVVLRTNFVGPGRIHDRKSFSDAIRDTLVAGGGFYGFEDSYFNPLSSARLAEEIARVMDRWNPGVYNLGASTGLSKYEFARQVALSSGLNAALVKPRLMASMSGLAPRPFNMVMNVDAYEAAFDTRLPTLEFLIKEIRDNPK